MTDRELLEAAAKASGFGNADGKFIWTDAEYPRGSKTKGALWNYSGYMYAAELWNPLTDDGDALRLAVKMGICFGPNFDGDMAVAFGREGKNITVLHGEDPCAATRRAIVLAAAAGVAAKEGGEG